MFLHCAIPAFHAAVHQAIRPEWRGRPLAVAIDDNPRAPLFSTSLEARTAGVHHGLRAGAGRQRCPELVVVTPDPDAYRRAQRALIERATAFTPRVGGPPGHLDLDLAGTERLHRRLDHTSSLDRPIDQAWEIARRLRATIAAELGLEAVCGVGGRLLTARCAARLAREPAHQRHRVVAIAPGHDDAALAPLPAAWLPDLGREELAALAECGLRRIGQVATLDREQLAILVGAATADGLAAWLTGDDEPVVPVHVDPAPQVRSALRAGPAGIADEDLDATAGRLAREVGFALREQGLACTEVVLEGTWVDGRTVRARCGGRGQLRQDRDLARIACQLLDRHQRRVRWRRLALAGCDLCPAEEQLRLFVCANDERIQTAQDHLRRHFGRDLVVPASWARTGA